MGRRACESHGYHQAHTYAQYNTNSFTDEYQNRSSNTVCGLDPLFCDETSQVWPDGKPGISSKIMLYITSHIYRK